MTPLMLACINNNYGIIRLLLERHLDLEDDRYTMATVETQEDQAVNGETFQCCSQVLYKTRFPYQFPNSVISTLFTRIFTYNID